VLLADSEDANTYWDLRLFDRSWGERWGNGHTVAPSSEGRESMLRLNVVWNMLTASMNGFYLIFCRSISHVYGACQLETHLVACSVQMSKNVMPVMRRLLGLSTYMNELRPSKFVVHVVSFYVLSGTFLAHSYM
jgi:hypothetical protein